MGHGVASLCQRHGHDHRLAHPLHAWSQLDAYLAERMPDSLAAGRLDRALTAPSRSTAPGIRRRMTHLALFERLLCLRGMQQTFEDFHLFPTEVDRLLGTLTEYLLEDHPCVGKAR